MLAVSASGNHWWLDGIVAIALLGIALAIDTFVRRAVTRRRAMTDLDADFPTGPPSWRRLAPTPTRGQRTP